MTLRNSLSRKISSFFFLFSQKKCIAPNKGIVSSQKSYKTNAPFISKFKGKFLWLSNESLLHHLVQHLLHLNVKTFYYFYPSIICFLYSNIEAIIPLFIHFDYNFQPSLHFLKLILCTTLFKFIYLCYHYFECSDANLKLYWFEYKHFSFE